MVLAPAVAVGVALAPEVVVAGVIQHPSHCEPLQTTVCECCKHHKRTMSFPMRTWRTLRNVRIKKCTAVATCFYFYYYYYYYYWTSIIKVSLSKKTSRTLYISQHYKKTVQHRFSTGELGRGNSEKMCLQLAPEGAECLWRWMANCSRCTQQRWRRSGHQSSNFVPWYDVPQVALVTCSKNWY